ncbi:MAG: xanthine dehydrogenase [Dethiobacter sp.]|nr:MAG: xanthine dehydrogenase [Dethiobacter sp.]
MIQKEIYKRLLQMVEKEEPAAMVTVLEAKGSVPGKPGFKMLVDLEGNTTGTVGGGLIEATLIKEAVEAIKNNTPKIGTYKLNQDVAGGLGMLCGGEVTAFVDVIAPQESLVIAGAGHIAQPLSAMAKILGFRVIVLDDREEFCNKERFPSAEQCLVGEIGEILNTIRITGNTYIVIVTRGHAYDEVALEKTINSEASYIGMIGSRNKVKNIFQNLLNKGFNESQLQKVHAPIGLDIGAKTPEEISVSILGEIILVKNKNKLGTSKNIAEQPGGPDGIHS